MPHSFTAATWDKMVKRFGLTKREARVVALMLGAERVPQIAKVLRLRPATVRAHISRALRRIGVGNAVDLLIRVLVVAYEVERDTRRE
jgi:DNA-binding CsgD family transcriptional regulator